MSWKDVIVSWRKLWTGSASEHDAELGRMITERLLEMTKHTPLGTTADSGNVDEHRERKKA
jgi:hypothetical protein